MDEYAASLHQHATRLYLLRWSLAFSIAPAFGERARAGQISAALADSSEVEAPQGVRPALAQMAGGDYQLA